MPYKDPQRGAYKARVRKVEYITYKGGKCALCGLEYDGTNGAVFQFHHRDPTLKKGGMTSEFRSKPWEVAVIELDKCVLLCANCHFKLHAGDY